MQAGRGAIAAESLEMREDELETVDELDAVLVSSKPSSSPTRSSISYKGKSAGGNSRPLTVDKEKLFEAYQTLLAYYPDLHKRTQPRNIFQNPPYHRN